MARGNAIVLAGNPKGHFEEIIVSGTPLPGTIMEIVPSTNPIGGRFTYRNVTRANGAKGPVAILDSDVNQGFPPGTRYVSGTQARIYWPIAGEELNAVLRETAGTGTLGEENIGDLLAIESATGELMAGGALASQPFYLLEHGGVSEAGDNLKMVKYLGNQA
jgi:hypothetical protein